MKRRLINLTSVIVMSFFVAGCAVTAPETEQHDVTTQPAVEISCLIVSIFPEDL